jgi:hypothetical protein
VKYVLRTVIGLGLMVAGLIAISIGIYELLGIGTCATGGPYVLARECPEGTEALGLVIPASIFVILGAGALYAVRGAPPGSEKRGDPALSLVIGWTGLFLGIGIACFWGVWGPDANPGPGATEGGLIVGFLFVPMGLIPLGIAFSIWLKRRRGDERPNYILDQVQRRAPVVAKSSLTDLGGGDALDKLERLQGLREKGAISWDEFERLKREVMDS